jgi:hypothetical protein
MRAAFCSVGSVADVITSYLSGYRLKRPNSILLLRDLVSAVGIEPTTY